ncbi:MAG: hypothetical protein IH852_04385 [Bacteroidetes bacterium]|nr:hypothetical protein [Bacteroidota bacterium]
MRNKDNITLRLIQLQPKIYKVRLQLPTETRFIGAINFTGDGVYYKKIKLSIHEFHKTSSVGFCYDLLNNYEFKWIKVFTDNRVLETSRRFVLEHGTIKQFYSKNLEKQIFLKLNLFGRDRAEQWENNNGIQTNLFEEVLI